MFTFLCTTDTGATHLINDIGYEEAEAQCERIYKCFVFIISLVGDSA